METKKTEKLTGLLLAPAVFCVLLASWSCEKRDVADLKQPTYSTSGEVFLDDFTPDLAYAAFGGSDVKAFQVVRDVTYNGSLQSMRFDVPDENSPNGSYAGGVFFSKVGRNLSGYNALTFYIKATQPATIGTLGFGNDLGENKYLVTLSGLPINSAWKKVVIPIPEAAKLTKERGLFYFAAAPENGRGYTFWVDDLKFENLGSLGIPTSEFYNGVDSTVSDAFFGDKVAITGFETAANLPTGVNQQVSVSPHYFNFQSSDTSVASVDLLGMVSIKDSTGTATITANVGNKAAKGSLIINFQGSDQRPQVKAPTPTQNASNVVSVYSDVYTEPTGVVLNPFWLGSTTQNAEIKVKGDNVVRYFNMNYVAMVLGSNVNVNETDAFHMDIWTPENVAGKSFKIELVDFGANGVFGGGDDRTAVLNYAALTTKQWVSIDVPFTSFSGPRPQGQLAQVVFSSTPNNSITNVFVDNVYLYKKQGLPTIPATAAPTPGYPFENVISIFSDSYTNVAGTNLNPGWGQATTVSQTPISGNNALVYTGLNYQGTELAADLDVSGMGFLHLDYYSGNSTSLNVFLISLNPTVEKPFALTVPTTTGWNSVDIPLSTFSPVQLTNIRQLKFDGNGTIYLDNILFRKN